VSGDSKKEAGDENKGEIPLMKKFANVQNPEVKPLYFSHNNGDT
jgi:hypothetical protein